MFAAKLSASCSRCVRAPRGAVEQGRQEDADGLGLRLRGAGCCPPELGFGGVLLGAQGDTARGNVNIGS